MTLSSKLLPVTVQGRAMSSFFYSSSDDEGASYESGQRAQKSGEFRVEVNRNGNPYYNLDDVGEYINLMKQEIGQVLRRVPREERETLIPKVQNLMALYFQNKDEIDFKFRAFKTTIYEYMKITE